ncbi:MAG: DUF262 domain-containing HNH endonuclease family protein [Hyphomonadaceae bacterium JAD_PAG50586_4]|nr:MAG: DUF262 domain-containing HNH endonuclease family protein [Hyphomonadaceae bacterium JAD_PAG50586_4]
MAHAFGDTPLGLTSQILNLASVLTRKAALKVPRYQRPYTWGEREVRQLIQDLWRAYQRRASFYFIGQIVLVKNHGKLEISDGQQRLSTLTMIIAYVRDRLPGRTRHYQALIMDGDQPRLFLREEDANFYRGYVQEPGQMSAMAQHAEIGIDSKDLLVGAARTIESELARLDDRELDAFISYVARCCTLNVVDADERGCAQTVFNTLNKRGSPLSHADIIKSDLLENSKLSNAEAEAAARKWEQIEDMFERENFAKLLYMMPFLLTGEQLLSPGDLAAFRTAVDRAGGVRTFLFDQLPRYAEALRAVFTGSIDVGPYSAEVNRRVKMMKQVEEWDWAPAAIAFLAEHSSEHERARKFFQALDRYAFACELGVIDNRVQEKRYERAVKGVGDDKQLHGEKGALELSHAEHLKFIATLNRSRKRDRQRRLLLLRVEAAMPGGSVLTMTDDATVEHIMPKSGANWWNERFPDSALRGELCHLLGNLTLITYEQNKVADNKPFPEKKRILFNSPGAPIHALTKSIANVDEWTLDVIEHRHEDLVRILCEDWGLVRGDD